MSLDEKLRDFVNEFTSPSRGEATHLACVPDEDREKGRYKVRGLRFCIDVPIGTPCLTTCNGSLYSALGLTDIDEEYIPR